MNKRDAPDYYDGELQRRKPEFNATVIVHPMDLSTIQKNIRAHKYKNKVDFAKDLNLIWDNCFLYNTQEVHRIRYGPRRRLIAEPPSPSECSLFKAKGRLSPRISRRSERESCRSHLPDLFVALDSSLARSQDAWLLLIACPCPAVGITGVFHAGRQ